MQQKPTVFWFVLFYNIIIMFLYFCITAFFMMIPFLDTQMEDGLAFSCFIGICMGPFIILQFIATGLMFFKGKIPYYGQVISIASGFTSLLTLIPCVFLLIAWLKDEVKEYYKIDSGWFSTS